MKKFKSGSVPNLPFKQAKKKPIPIRCIQIDEAFEVETMEGTMKAKAGDWLVVGIDEEMYAIDRDIFERTYELISK